MKSFVSVAEHPEELPLAQHGDSSSGDDFVSDYELRLMSNIKKDSNFPYILCNDVWKCTIALIMSYRI